jgi:hypothetical protein
MLVIAGCLYAAPSWPQQYAPELSKQCTEDIQRFAKEDIKIVLSIDETGNVQEMAPYKQPLALVKFPLSVAQVLGPPKVITITPYTASPAKMLVCFWRMGQYVCY